MNSASHLIYEPLSGQIGGAAKLLPGDDVIHADAPLELPLRPVRFTIHVEPGASAAGFGGLSLRMCRRSTIDTSHRASRQSLRPVGLSQACAAHSQGASSHAARRT